LQRNFQGYSTRAGSDIYSFGMSAISQIPDAYWQNEKELPKYQAAVDAGNVPLHRAYFVTAEDKLRRETIMRTMCDLSLDFAAMSAKLGINFEQHFAKELAALAVLLLERRHLCLLVNRDRLHRTQLGDLVGEVLILLREPDQQRRILIVLRIGQCGGFVGIRAVVVAVVVLATLVASPALAQRVLVPEREWSDATGMFKVQASLVGIEGTALTLRQTDGSDLTIELDQLAPLDPRARRTPHAPLPWLYPPRLGPRQRRNGPGEV
jgi:hypothetical protein